MKLTAAQEGNIDSTGITTDDYNNMHPTADNIERLKRYSGRLGRLLTLDLAQSAIPNFHTLMFLEDTDPAQHEAMLLTITILKDIIADNKGFTPK